MTIETALVVIAGILAVVDLLRSHGESLAAWGVLLIVAALLRGVLW